MDFGTALLEGAKRLTWRHLGESLGTPDYMSPEQIQGERGDARSDIYGWGILMYEFLTGRVPFDGDNWMAVMAGHLHQNPKPIRQLRPDVPAGARSRRAQGHAALSRTTATRPPPSCSTTSTTSTRSTRPPSTSRPRSRWAGWRRWTRTKRIWAIVALVAVGFLGIIAVIITVAYVA